MTGSNPPLDFSVAADTLEHLLDCRNYKLQIPHYQRPYQWGKADIYSLLQDLHKTHRTKTNLVGGSDQHLLLGSIVLYQRTGDVFHDVVDGQQRLSSLVLLHSALYVRLEEQLAKLGSGTLAEPVSKAKSQLDSLKQCLVSEKAQLLTVRSPQDTKQDESASQIRTWDSLCSLLDVQADKVNAMSGRYAKMWARMYNFIGRMYCSSSKNCPQTHIESLLSFVTHIRKNVYLSITVISNMKLALRSFVRCNATGECMQQSATVTSCSCVPQIDVQ